ncbi:hypothetical protein Tco_1030898 [Tanacetum coccineum]|uniref:Uncharacterized protein n=1 Tax=Tanacetum coccineum TaxID=301880 RepID=A0ABQ5G7I4_9ASTR
MRRSRIDCVMDHDNVLHEGTEVPIIFVDHYMQFLGVESTITPLNHEGLFIRKLSQIPARIMIRDVNDDEIRTAMFSIGNDKAPGPDGFTFVFFKKAWDVVGNDVCKAVQFFFQMNAKQTLICDGRKLLQIRHNIRPHIWYKIGNAIANAGFSLDDKIKDVVSNGAWKWPSTRFVAYPVLISMPIPILNDDQEDILQWRKYDGSFDSFSVREAWNTIREHANEAQPDSHDHLFFECPYSSRVWLQVLHMADIQFASSKWRDIIDWLLPILKQSFLSPKGRGRWNGVKEKIKNVADIPVANKEYNDDFVKGNSVTGNVKSKFTFSPTVLLPSPLFHLQHWQKGKASNARPMVEVRADFELKDTIVVLVPKFFGDGYIVSTIYVEYEWATPRCSSCHVFVMPLEWKCVLVDDDGKPLEKVDYSSNQGSEDEVDLVDNEMTSYLSPGVEYATKSLLEQWRKTYVDDDYDPYDDDMYEGQEISDNIQSICNNSDIKVRGRLKK